MIPELAAELDAALAELRAKHPGITNGDAALMLPQHLVQPMWERAVDRYLDEQLAKLEPTETQPPQGETS